MSSSDKDPSTATTSSKEEDSSAGSAFELQMQLPKETDTFIKKEEKDEDTKTVLEGISAASMLHPTAPGGGPTVSIRHQYDKVTIDGILDSFIAQDSRAYPSSLRVRTTTVRSVSVPNDVKTAVETKAPSLWSIPPSVPGRTETRNGESSGSASERLSVPGAADQSASVRRTAQTKTEIRTVYPGSLQQYLSFVSLRPFGVRSAADIPNTYAFNAFYAECYHFVQPCMEFIHAAREVMAVAASVGQRLTHGSYLVSQVKIYPRQLNTTSLPKLRDMHPSAGDLLTSTEGYTALLKHYIFLQLEREAFLSRWDAASLPNREVSDISQETVDLAHRALAPSQAQWRSQRASCGLPASEADPGKKVEAEVLMHHLDLAFIWSVSTVADLRGWAAVRDTARESQGVAFPRITRSQTSSGSLVGE